MNNELYHYGVLGMKWGRRKARPTSSKTSRRSKKSKNNDLSKMSDAELRQKINRMQMEQQYNNLSKPRVNAGVKFTQDVLKNAAQQTAGHYVSKYMRAGVDYTIKYVGNKIKK